ncbi:PREDICTED: phosphatidate cytidylyltransferase, mitochondrial [Dinoponera quadriceps]|uniref:Phosphatidate cytidylyltransferase, mitochondrial n=1 Tax=Dinoponera quadriceps TaxID=609295 RepID=A0A6P3X031_DINQU|nr:PREDICTED: phosphatidate cytidylyltransferase, mitochondrial [Dinoponera quadriceps]
MLAKIPQVSPLRHLLREFPGNVKFCFAYGSGVFRQANNDNENMLDLIFVARNPNKWHAENLQRNPGHYAHLLRLLGHKAITRVQEGSGANIYYNTLIRTSQGQLVKYGVISEVSLMEDLLDWNHLYLSGRLHKPVKVLVEPDEGSQLRTALVQNLHSAVHATLLLLPEHFTEIEFFRKITGLSYHGDFRMIFGENKEKINNIVAPQLAHFKQLYEPVLKHFDNYVDIPRSDDVAVACHQDTSPAAKVHHLNHLPRTPQIKLVRAWSHGPRSRDTEDCLRAVAHDPECCEILEQCLKDIVWRSSVTQSLKGIVTAGLVKSVKYSGAKIIKMLQSNGPDRRTLAAKPDSSKIEKIVEAVVKKTEAKGTEKRVE